MYHRSSHFLTESECLTDNDPLVSVFLFLASFQLNPGSSTHKNYHLSPKLVALLEHLRGELSQGNKAIIFSQFTSFLDIIESVLDRNRISWVRLDGNMAAQQRTQSLTAFQNNPDVKVFLISLKAGGVGLNLTAANVVYMMDPWWNPAAEDQAVDRAHRHGQTKDVTVVRFIVKDSVEEGIMELQKRKREMTSTALSSSGKSREELQEARLNDLISLFK